MIFAAGLGTRLRPLTNDIPKALVKLDGKPLLEHVIIRMKEIGVKRIVVNVHHFAEKVIAFLDSKEWGVDINISHEKDLLLDTGGGLYNAKDLFIKDEPILIYNVDVLSDMNLDLMINNHTDSSALVTLLARSSYSDRVFMQKDNRLTGWQNLVTGEKKIVDNDFYESEPIGFTGIQILSYRIFDLIEERGVFSIVDLYLRLAKTEKIHVLVDNNCLWMDLGTPKALVTASELVR